MRTELLCCGTAGQRSVLWDSPAECGTVGKYDSHLTSRMSNRALHEQSYLVAYVHQKICGDLPEMTAFKSYAAKHKRKSHYANLLTYPWSAFSTRCTAKHQRLPRDCQRHLALPKTVPTVAASPCWSEN